MSGLAHNIDTQSVIRVAFAHTFKKGANVWGTRQEVVQKMDWNQVGAIATVIVGLPGIVTFFKTTWPYPQLKRLNAAVDIQAMIPVAIGPKIIAGSLIGSVVLSCVSIYAAWHPAKFKYPPDFGHLQQIDCEAGPNAGRKFVSETVEIDGKEFVNCYFENAKLLFHGNDTFSLQHNLFEHSVVYTTDNHAIAAFVELLAVSEMLETQEHGVTFNSGKGFTSVSRTFPPGQQRLMRPQVPGPE
jgi:hypothetical protein